MSTMDPIELARWTRFAMKGGIGKCTALTDCVAESSEDLMFLKDDEIVVLLQVADKEGVYLGYCEGVIGRFSGSHVRFHGKLKKPVMARRASSSTASVSSSREGSTPNTFAKSPTPTFTPPSSRLGGSFGVAGAGSAREGGLGREGVARDGLSRDGTSSRTSTPASPFPNLSNVGAMRSDSRASLGRHHHHMSMSATIQDHTSSSPSSSATPASTSAPPVSAASPPLVDQQQSGRMVGGEVEEEEARPPQFAFSSNTHSPSPSVRNLEQQFHLVEEGWRRGSIRDSSVVSSARVSVDVDADAEEGKARPAPLELLEAHVDPLRITKKSPVVSPAVPAFIEEREGRMPIDEGTALEERSRSSLVDSPNTTVEGSSSSSTTTTATTTTATPSSSNTAPTPSSKNAPLTLSLTNDDSPSEYGDDDDDDDHPLKPPNTSLMPDTSYSTTSFSNRFSVASAEGVVGIGLSLLQDLADGMSDSDSDEDEGEGRGGEDGLGSAGTATYANVGRGGGGVDGVGSGPGSAGLTRNASVRSVDTVDGLRYGDDSEDEDDDDDDEDGPSTSTFFPMPPNTHQDVQLPPGTLSRTHSLAQSARSFGHGHNQSLGGGHGHKQSLGGLGGVGGGGVGVNRSPPQVHTSPPIPSSSPPSTVLQKFPTTDGSSLSPTSPTYPHHAHSHHQHQHQPPNPPYLHYSHQRERRPSEAPSVRSIRSIAHSVRSSGTAATSSSWEGAGDIYDDYRYSRFSMGSVSGFGGSPSGFGGSPSGFSGGGSIGGGGPGSPVPGATFAGAMGAGAGGSLGRAAGKRMSSMSAVTAASEQDVVPPVPVRRGSEGPGVLGVSGGGGGGVGSNAGAGGSNVGVGERGRVLSLDSKAPSVSTTPLGEGEDDESKRSTLRRDSDASVYTQASSSRMSLALSAFKTNPNQHNPHADSFDGRSTAMSGFTAASGFTSTSGFTATSTSGYTTTSNAHGTRPPPLDLQRQRHTSTSTSSSNATSDPENQRSPLLHATWGSPLSSPGMGEHGSPGSGIAMGVAIGSPGAMGYGSPGAGGYGMVSVGNVAIHDGLGSPTSHIGPGAMSGGGMLGVVNPGMAGGTFGRAGGGGIASALRQRVEDERKVGTGGSSLMSLFDGQNQGNAGVKGGYQHSGEEKGEGSMDLSRDGGDDSNDLSTSTNDVDLSRSLDGDTTADLTRSTDFSQSTDLSRSTDGDTSRFTANDTTNDISLTESERRTLGLGRRIVVEDDEELPSVVEDSYTSVGSGESGETEVGGGRDEKQASNTAVKDPSQRQSRQQIILDRARSQREMDRDGEQDMSLVSTTEYSQSSSKDSEDGLAYGTDEDEEDDNVTILPHTPLSAAAPPLPPSLTISSSSRPSTPAEQGSSAASASTTTTATGSTTTTASSTLAPPGQPSHLRPSLRELREGATVRVPGTGERRSLFMPHPGAPKAPKDLGVEESEGPMFLRGEVSPVSPGGFQQQPHGPAQGQVPPPGQAPGQAPGPGQQPAPPGGYPYPYQQPPPPMMRPSARQIILQALSRPPPPAPAPIPRPPGPGMRVPPPPIRRGPTIYGRIEGDFATSMGPIPITWSVDPPPTKARVVPPSASIQPGGVQQPGGGGGGVAHGPGGGPHALGGPHVAGGGPHAPGGGPHAGLRTPPTNTTGLPPTAPIQSSPLRAGSVPPGERGMQRMGSFEGVPVRTGSVPPGAAGGFGSASTVGGGGVGKRPSVMSLREGLLGSTATHSGLSSTAEEKSDSTTTTTVKEGNASGGSGSSNKPIPRANFFPKVGGIGVRPRSRSFSGLGAGDVKGRPDPLAAPSEIKKSASLTGSSAVATNTQSSTGVKSTPHRPSPLSLPQNTITNSKTPSPSTPNQHPMLRPRISTPNLKSPSSPLARDMTFGQQQSQMPPPSPLAQSHRPLEQVQQRSQTPTSQQRAQTPTSPRRTSEAQRSSSASAQPSRSSSGHAQPHRSSSANAQPPTSPRKLGFGLGRAGSPESTHTSGLPNIASVSTAGSTAANTSGNANTNENGIAKSTSPPPANGPVPGVGLHLRRLTGSRSAMNLRGSLGDDRSPSWEELNGFRPPSIGGAASASNSSPVTASNPSATRPIPIPRRGGTLSPPPQPMNASGGSGSSAAPSSSPSLHIDTKNLGDEPSSRGGAFGGFGNAGGQFLDNRSQLVTSPTALSPTIGRQNSLRSKLSLPNLRRNKNKQDDALSIDGPSPEVLLQVQDMEFELVRPALTQFTAARASEDSVVLGRDMGPALESAGSTVTGGSGGSFLRAESPAFSISSGGRSPTVDVANSWGGLKSPGAGGSSLSMLSGSASPQPYGSPAAPPPDTSTIEAHRNREQKWMSLLSSSPPSQARKTKKVRKLLLEGVPSSVRYLVWSHLTDGKAKCVAGVYPQLCKRGKVPLSERIEQEVESGEWFLDEERAQLRLLKEAGGGVVQLLQAYLNMVPDIEYSSGLPHIVGQLLLLAPEEDAFWIFVSIMDTHIRSYFSTTSSQMEVDAALFSRALEVNDPPIAKKLFVDMGILPVTICKPWFESLFVGCLPDEFLARSWDVFLYDGIPFLLRVGLAIVAFVRRQLLDCTSEEAVLQLLHRPPPISLPSNAENYLNFVLGTVKLKDDDVKKQRVKMEAQVKKQIQQQQGPRSAGSISLPR